MYYDFIPSPKPNSASLKQNHDKASLTKVSYKDWKIKKKTKQKNTGVTK